MCDLKVLCNYVLWSSKAKIKMFVIGIFLKTFVLLFTDNKYNFLIIIA